MNTSEQAKGLITFVKLHMGKVPIQTFINSTNTTMNSTFPTVNVTNSTIAPLQNPSQSGFTLTEVVIMSTAMVILMIVTLFGNCLVLGIFYQYTPLRTVTNYFIVSLANADLLVALLSIPIWIAYLQVDLAELKFGEEVWHCFNI